MNRGIALILGILGTSVAATASAQSLRTLDEGTRVRVRLENAAWPFVAVVREVRTDTLVLARPNRQIESQLPLALSQIASLEVSGGRRRLTFIGIAAGSLLGLGLSAAYNGIVQSQCEPSCPDPFPVWIGAAVGATTFGVGFYFLRSERWLEISLPRRGLRR